MPVRLADQPQAVEVLAEGARLLDMLKVHWWLSAGTALGVYRDGCLIPWDNDLDVGVREDPGVFDLLDKTFPPSGFESLRSTPYQRAYTRRDVVFDIYVYRVEGDLLVAHTEHGRLVKPARLISELAYVEFGGESYPMPSPPEDYLRVRYGDDWRTPRASKRNWIEDAAHLVRE